MIINLIRKELLLSYDNDQLPARGSADIPVSVSTEPDDPYADYYTEVHCSYLTHHTVKEIMLDKEDDLFIIPGTAFAVSGNIALSVNLVKDSTVIATNEVSLFIKNAPHGTVVLPATEDWHTFVQDYLDKLYTDDYRPLYDDLIEEAQQQQQTASDMQQTAIEQQENVDDAISSMGEYEIVNENPTQIRYKKGNGQFGDTVNLGDNLASKSQVFSGHDTYAGNSYNGLASDSGIEIASIKGNYKQDGTPTPNSPIEPKFFEMSKFVSHSNNLFDQSKLLTKSQGGATVTNNGDGSFTISGSGTLSVHFNHSYSFTHEETLKLLKAGKLTLIQNGDTYPRAVVNLRSADGTKNYFSLNETATYANITEEMINDGGCRLVIYIHGISGQAIKSGTIKPMLYQDGNGVWEKFNLDTTPASLTLRALPNGVCDTWEDGITTRRVGKITFDGSEDEAWSSQDGRFYISIPGKKYGIDQPLHNLICNKLITEPWNTLIANMRNMTIKEHGEQTNERVYIRNDSCSTIEELKTWLQSNQITVWYELATPTTELLDIPTLPSYYPFTNIWHDSEVEASEIKWKILTTVNGIVTNDWKTENPDKKAPSVEIVKKEIDEIKTVGVQVADTLPIGSQVAWDDNEPIPDGWEEADTPFINDNLLINSDFRSGVINQKGQTTYDFSSETTSKLNIDMWVITKMKLNVCDGYIRIENNDTTSHSLSQNFSKQFSGKHLWYVNVKSVTDGAYLWTYKKLGEPDYYRIGDLTHGENAFVYGNDALSFQNFGISIPAGGYIELYNCKLEKGKLFTGMPAWNEGLELLKCLQYATVIKAYTGVYTGRLDGTRCTFLIPYPVKMKNKPTINLTNLRVFYGATNTEVIDTPSDVTIDSHSTHLVITFLSKIAGSHCTVALFSTTYIDGNNY